MKNKIALVYIVLGLIILPLAARAAVGDSCDPEVPGCDAGQTCSYETRTCVANTSSSGSSASTQVQECQSDSDCSSGQTCYAVTSKCVSPSNVANPSNIPQLQPSDPNSNLPSLPSGVGNGGITNAPEPSNVASGVVCPQGYEKQGPTCVPKGGSGLAGAKTITGIIKIVIDFLLYMAGLVAVVFIVLGGFWYITSGGNEEQAEKGKKSLINAVIGLVIVMMALVIVNVVANTLGNGSSSATGSSTTTVK